MPNYLSISVEKSWEQSWRVFAGIQSYQGFHFVLICLSFLELEIASDWWKSRYRVCLLYSYFPIYIYIRVCLTLNPVHECVSIAFQWSVGRPVCRCVARRAWSGLESRKSRQRSKTMNSYSANVASEISMRARNAARMLQKFRDAGTGPRVYLHTSYDIIPFFHLHHSKPFLSVYHVCVYQHRPIIDPEKEEREREWEESFSI